MNEPHSSVETMGTGERVSLDLERLELREVQMPLVAPFETSFGRITRRRILIVRVFDRSGAFGWGECTALEGPFFNHETIETAWLITTQFLAPLLEQARPREAAMVSEAFTSVRDHHMAKAGVETAIW